MELSGIKGIGLLIYALLGKWMIEDLGWSSIPISADKIPRWFESTSETFIMVREHHISHKCSTYPFNGLWCLPNFRVAR